MIKNFLLSCLLLMAHYQCFAQQNVTYSTYSGQPVITAPGSITFTDGFYVPAGSTFRAYISMPSVTPVPSADQNYIMRAKVKVPGITSESALNSVLNDKSKVEVTIQYFDGLGRQMQTVQQQGSPSGNDVIQPVFYDSLGRETKQYLPYVPTSTANGAYRSAAVSDQQSFYNSPPAGVISIPSGSGQVAYSQTQFEASPLNRVLQQGYPGGDWKIGGGHTQRQGYGINGANEVRIWKVTSNGATGTTYFPKARLYTDTLTDEDGYKTITYTDYDKKVRLKRVQDASGYLSTYYVYDDLNNLRYVLPPGFTAASFTESDTAFDQFVYAYHYNGKRQVTEKKIPGKGWEYMVYNRIDRMVMSQDANQRAKAPQEWTIFKYDELGRLVLTGIYSHTGSSAGTSYRSAQQGAVDANSNFWESSLSTGTGYTANTYPTSWDRTLTINYFDTYNIPGKDGLYDATQTVRSNVQGLSTGSKVNILGTSGMLLTVNYYDEEERLIESISDNHLSGTDRVVNTWNFADELIASTRTHISNPIPGGMTIANRYEYDHMGRKTKTYEKIGSDTEVTLSELNYNELGQVYTKNQGGGKQTTTYSYNSRGWLTGKSAPLFAMQLKYNDGTVPRYNGNITNQLWGTPGNLSNTFSYSYDPLSRLISGDAGSSYEKDISYDNMGNILSLNRNGTGMQSYSYSGNRLSSVSGGISRSYTYDANGNALTDGTNTLTYNYMNLPSTVSGGAAITYTYDALGRKLRSVNGGVTRDYISGIQYTGGVLDFIQTEEGLTRKSGSNYLYEYNLTDHLGNNRLSFDIYSNAAREIQHDSYLPFGKTYNSYTLGVRNNYLYNGKELQDGFGQYDYGARFYDPITGRWNVPDPMAEADRAYSPYNYARNNPIRFIDRNGMYWEEAFAGIMIGLPFDDIYLNEKGKEIYRKPLPGPDHTFLIKTTKTTSDIYSEEERGSKIAGNSNPISETASKSTEKEIARGNLSGAHMNNVIEIENKTTLAAMFNSGPSSDNGRGGTSDPNNREYGGTVSFDGEVTASIPGAVNNPKNGNLSTVTNIFTKNTKTDYHSHESGSIIEGSSTFKYIQGPSSIDINDSGSRVSYVFGRGSGLIYIYNGTGVIATLPDKFLKK